MQNSNWGNMFSKNTCLTGDEISDLAENYWCKMAAKEHTLICCNIAKGLRLGAVHKWRDEKWSGGGGCQPYLVNPKWRHFWTAPYTNQPKCLFDLFDQPISFDCSKYTTRAGYSSNWDNSSKLMHYWKLFSFFPLVFARCVFVACFELLFLHWPKKRALSVNV